MNISDLMSVAPAAVADSDGLSDFPPRWWHVVVVGAISTGVIAANILVILVFSTSPDLRRTTSRFMYLSLAVGDLCVGWVCVAAIHAAHEGHWPYSHEACLVCGFLMMLSNTVSPWSICLLTVDRYLAVCRPLSYRSIVTANRVIVACAGMWVFAVVVSVPALLTDNGYVYMPVWRQCTADMHSLGLNLFTSVTVYLPPCITMAVCYYRILVAVNNLVLPAGLPDHHVRTLNKSRKATRTVAIVAGTFFATWTPVTLLMPFNFYVTPVPGTVLFVAGWIAMTNSFWNAVIYSATNKEFKQALKDLVGRSTAAAADGESDL